METPKIEKIPVAFQHLITQTNPIIKNNIHFLNPPDSNPPSSVPATSRTLKIVITFRFFRRGGQKM